MIFSDLPPVGSKVSWVSSKKGEPSAAFDGYDTCYVNSGTSALALSCLIAKTVNGSEQAEIIVPAYGCPDLIAAVHFSGCQTVLVDCASPFDPAFDLEKLSQSISEYTVAVIAVNFLGVRERLPEIKKRLPESVLLIEDNAQWYPELDDQTQLIGDIAINSFGRGKPASVLGGGMVLVRHHVGRSILDVDEYFFSHSVVNGSSSRSFKSYCVFTIYNLLLSPHLYVLLSHNPFLSLGETHYHALEKIESLDSVKKRLLDKNIANYVNLPRVAEAFLDDVVYSNDALCSPALMGKDEETSYKDSHENRRKRLLRYPLVFKSTNDAHAAYQALRENGLGATRFYQQPLMAIMNDSNDVDDARVRSISELVNARQFSERILTLPVHQGVTPKHLGMMRDVLKSVLN